jgi:proteasome assembly chaperone (PAC2) family protein
MEPVSYQSHPELRRPVLISAFGGWNDAGDAATLALGHLGGVFDAQEFASIDPEEFFDFQAHRPTVRLEEGDIRSVQWPSTTFSHASLPGTDRHVVLLAGTEPSMRWRTFTGSILDVARDAGVEFVITLGALLAGRPHTRPIRVSGFSWDRELAERLGLGPSRYEGPTGIVGVFADACRRAGIPSVSLWAWVPHYLQGTPSPRAALEIVRRLRALLDCEIDVADLEDASRTYDERVEEAVRSDPDIVANVAELERHTDAEDIEDLPSREELAAEVERFLREQGPPPDER